MGVSIQKRFFQVKQAAGLGPAVYPSVLRARGYSVSGGSPRIRSLAISSPVGPVSLTVSLATYLITTSGAKSDKRINGVAYCPSRQGLFRSGALRSASAMEHFFLHHERTHRARRLGGAPERIHGGIILGGLAWFDLEKSFLYTD